MVSVEFCQRGNRYDDRSKQWIWSNYDHHCISLIHKRSFKKLITSLKSKNLPAVVNDGFEEEEEKNTIRIHQSLTELNDTYTLPYNRKRFF